METRCCEGEVADFQCFRKSGSGLYGYAECLPYCMDGWDCEVLIAFPPAPDTGRMWSSDLTVPADCNAQRIVLRAASTLVTEAVSPWIDSIVMWRVVL